MANKYAAPRNGNKVNEEGLLLGFLNALAGAQNSGNVEATAYQISQASPTANMSVDIALGHYIIPYLSYFFPTWSTVKQNLTIAASNVTNPRISRIIAYIDLSVADTTNSNTPDGVKFIEVAGTPAGSPVAPNDAAVQAAVGASNPWDELARITVDANVTTILNAKITDYRTAFLLAGGLGGLAVSGNGVLAVANNISSLAITPKTGIFTNLYARVKTAPTGADLIGRINKNGVSAATFTITASSVNVTVSGLSIPYVPGDYFTLDITQIGSTIAGSDLGVSLG